MQRVPVVFFDTEDRSIEVGTAYKNIGEKIVVELPNPQDHYESYIYSVTNGRDLIIAIQLRQNSLRDGDSTLREYLNK